MVQRRAALRAEQARIAVGPVEPSVTRDAVGAGKVRYLIRVAREAEPTPGQSKQVAIGRAVWPVAIQAAIAEAAGHGAVLEDVWAALLFVALAALAPNLLGIAHG